MDNLNEDTILGNEESFGDVVSHKIHATDSFLAVLGKTNIAFETVMSEFLNNSIQAAEDRDLDLYVEIEFDFDDDEQSKCNSVAFKDKSGGIPLNQFQNCVTPAKNINPKTTLNEHGIGLNLSLEWCTRDTAEYSIKSYTESGAFALNEKISFERDFNTVGIENTEPPGLHIFISNITDEIDLKWPSAPASELYKIWAVLCAKYRFKHKDFNARGKNFNIIFNLKKGDTPKSTGPFKPCPPLLKNPHSTKNDWITSFILENDDYTIKFNFGAADLEKAAYGSQEIDYVGQNNHPYRISSENIGFDVIYKGVVIDFMNRELIPIGFNRAMHGGVNWNQFSCLRGEMHILKGGRSFFTKNGIDADKSMKELLAQAHRILLGISI